MRELRRIVKPGGKINIQAWAMDQEEGSKRKFVVPDAFVPFNAQPRYLAKVNTNEASNQRPDTKDTGKMYAEAYDGAELNERNGLVVFQRYCHMYCNGELEDLVGQVEGLLLLESGFEAGNYYVILEVTKD